MHRHPLFYSRIDSGFVASLGSIAEQEIVFIPAGLWQEVPSYDPIDAYYLPLGDFGDLQQPGPEIEIWRVKPVPLPAKERLSVKGVFARGYVAGAAEALGKGRTEEALSLGQRARALDEQCAEAYFILAFAHQQRQESEKALAMYVEHLRRQPESSAAYHNLAALYQSIGRTERAEQMLLEALRRAPWKRQAWAILASFYRHHNSPEQVQIYAELLVEFPNQPLAYETLGQACEQAGLSTRAEAAYQEGLRRDARHEPFYLHLARLYLTRQHYGQAIEACEALLRVNPRQAEAHRLLAHTCRHLGQLGKARDHAREAVRLAPGADPPLEAWLAGQ